MYIKNLIYIYIGELVWKFDGLDFIESSPLIVNDLIFVGSENNSLYGLHLKDGTVAAQFNCTNWITRFI